MIPQPKRTRSLSKFPLLAWMATVLMALTLSAVLTPALARAEQLPEDSFAYVESSEVPQGDVQRIALVFGTGRQVSSANLFYEVGGTAYSVPSSAVSEDSALFEFPAMVPGTSRLASVSVRYADSQEECSYDLSALTSEGDKDACSFTVSQQTDDGVAAYSASAADAPAVIASDDSGAVREYASLSDASSAISTQSTFSQDSSGPFVICLDPGHGPGESNPGSVSHGLKECNLTLSIANYCKAALEKYPDVKVIMTHDGKTGTSDLYERVNDAVDAGADVYVSLHMNAIDGSASMTAHGAEVWYPNGSSYKRDQVALGVTLSANILNRLSALGLYSRGAKTYDYPDGYDSSTYPDGSKADYYAVIRYARKRGILGIIVEHAFITNDSDAAFLSKESNLKALGEADAVGIAKTYGLRTNGSWQRTYNGWRYLVDGKPLTGWFWVSGSRYYADSNGDVHNPGWLLMNGSWYWFDSNCASVTGWANVNGSRYYFDRNGVMKTGLQTIDGSLYYFMEAGNDEGAMQTGWQTVDQKRYFFDENGQACVSRWYQSPDGTWHWFDASGAMKTGWLNLGVWYWFDESGTMATGWRNVNGSLYYFDASGAMQTGWLNLGGTWYYLDSSGAALKGWQRLGSWYWLDPDTGAMATGWHLCEGSWSRFEDSGAWIGYGPGGWNLIDDAWYWLEGAGTPKTGWLHNGSSWYWLESGSGKAAVGWEQVGGNWYWFDQSCAMRTGWLNLGVWYWMDSSGAMTTGWQNVGGTWYFMAGSGAMQTGWLNLGGTWYWLDSSGAMVTGNKTIDGVTYTFDSSGALVSSASSKPSESAKSGWSHEGSSWYYYKNGSRQTGWVMDGSWYYLDGSGVMQTGWVYDGSAWYNLSDSGAWTGEEQPNVTIVGSPTLSKSAFVSKAAAVFAASGSTYPSSDLSAGGASSIEQFCTQLYEEAVDEGVRPELVFCQSMLETGWLRFGGQVKIGQFNFAGIGAVDGGTTAASFGSVREGLRAQVQHLKAYAVPGVTTSSLAHGCVDPRFSLVTKGSAPYVQWLGIKENPEGRGWATSRYYGIRLVNLMSAYFGL